MKRWIANSIAAAVLFVGTAAAAPVSLEIAYEGRGQITAPQQWLQLLTKAGVANVRIRGAQAGDQPSLETIESSRGSVQRVVGVLTQRGELALPGGRFTQRDVAKLRDYFDRLKADGADGVLEPTGNFGLTKKQFEETFQALSAPLATPTNGQATAAIVETLRRRIETPIVIDPAAATPLRRAEPQADELRSLSIGTGLAIALRRDELALAPRKPRGKPVELAIVRWDEEAEQWPAGYRAKGAPRNTAPELMQSINVEIDGFTLAEATGAITPRLKLPVLWDTAAMSRAGIDPAQVDVRLPRAKLSYKRILEKLLFQARLRGELRTDEAGTPFYWIGK